MNGNSFSTTNSTQSIGENWIGDSIGNGVDKVNNRIMTL